RFVPAVNLEGFGRNRRFLIEHALVLGGKTERRDERTTKKSRVRGERPGRREHGTKHAHRKRSERAYARDLTLARFRREERSDTAGAMFERERFHDVSHGKPSRRRDRRNGRRERHEPRVPRCDPLRCTRVDDAGRSALPAAYLIPAPREPLDN